MIMIIDNNDRGLSKGGLHLQDPFVCKVQAKSLIIYDEHNLEQSPQNYSNFQIPPPQILGPAQTSQF